MARKKSVTRELYWRDLMARQAASGLSIRQFCAKEQVSEPSFYTWRQKLHGRKHAPAQPGSSSRPVQETSGGREFIPLTLVDDPGALEVIHPRGYRLRVTGDVNPATLQRVLEILDGRTMG